METFDELTDAQKQTLINKCYPDIILEIEKVSSWIKDEKIILNGKTNEFGRLEYIDKRTDLEKNNSKDKNG